MVKESKVGIGKISSKIEFIIVFIGAFGFFLFGAISAYVSHKNTTELTNRYLILMPIYEVIVFSILAWFLNQRDWNLVRVGLIPNWKSTLAGIGLAVLAYILSILNWIVFSPLFPDALIQSKAISGLQLNLALIILTSIVNGIFEEVFVVGYIIHFFKQLKSPWIAVMISTMIRTLYHVYTPTINLLFIVWMGLMFGFYYVRTNQLWTLAIAHIMLDIYGLLMISQFKQ
jgi:uncharacterized protein